MLHDPAPGLGVRVADTKPLAGPVLLQVGELFAVDGTSPLPASQRGTRGPLAEPQLPCPEPQRPGLPRGPIRDALSLPTSAFTPATALPEPTGSSLSHWPHRTLGVSLSIAQGCRQKGTGSHPGLSLTPSQGALDTGVHLSWWLGSAQGGLG